MKHEKLYHCKKHQRVSIEGVTWFEANGEIKLGIEIGIVPTFPYHCDVCKKTAQHYTFCPLHKRVRFGYWQAYSLKVQEDIKDVNRFSCLVYGSCDQCTEQSGYN